MEKVTPFVQKIRRAVFEVYTKEKFKMTEEKRNYVFDKVITQFGHQHADAVNDAINFFIEVDNGMYDKSHLKPMETM